MKFILLVYCLIFPNVFLTSLISQHNTEHAKQITNNIEKSTLAKNTNSSPQSKQNNEKIESNQKSMQFLETNNKQFNASQIVITQGSGGGVAPQNDSIQSHSGGNDTYKDIQGKDFFGVKYVPKISPYANEDLIDMLNTKNFQEKFIGKPLFLINNSTYDETPEIYKDALKDQVVNVRHEVQPIGYIDASQQKVPRYLWKNYVGDKMYQDVQFVGQNVKNLLMPKKVGEIDYNDVDIIKHDDGSIEDHIEHHLKTPKISLTNENIQNDNKGPKVSVDTLINQISNPIKKRVYETSQHSTTKLNNKVQKSSIKHKRRV